MPAASPGPAKSSRLVKRLQAWSRALARRTGALRLHAGKARDETKLRCVQLLCHSAYVWTEADSTVYSAAAILDQHSCSCKACCMCLKPVLPYNWDLGRLVSLIILTPWSWRSCRPAMRRRACTPSTRTLAFLAVVVLTVTIFAAPWWWPWLLWRESTTSFVSAGPGDLPSILLCILCWLRAGSLRTPGLSMSLCHVPISD